jgi:hypothetical protein
MIYFSSSDSKAFVSSIFGTVCYLHYHAIVCVVFVQFIRTFLLDAQSENLLSNMHSRHRSSSFVKGG